MSQNNKPQKRSTLQTILIALLALLVVLGTRLDLFPVNEEADVPTSNPVVSQPDVSASGDDGAAQTAAPITDPQEIADYIFAHGHLPDNFLTKAEAQRLGWDSGSNYVSDVAPGMSIGGDRFGNYEGLLPSASGRTWKEADVNYTGGPRGAERIVFSNDGLVYYTSDHYESFVQMHPSR